MTIFYGGQAHVFDNVHPNKVIFFACGLCLETIWEKKGNLCFDCLL